MCFDHSFLDTITRADAMTRIGAFAAIPLLPRGSISPTQQARALNSGHAITAIIGGTAFAGDDLKRIENATILIERNRIARIGPAHEVHVPPNAYRINAHGKYVIPGLIDAHVHFFQSGGLYTRPDAIDLRSVRPYTDELAWVRDNLHDTFARYLRAGITSVVDVGGPFWNYDVRTEANRTKIAPRVMVAGPLISSVEREILDPHGDPPIVKIDTLDAAKALVDRELEAKTDFVKFWWILPASGDATGFRPIVQGAIDYAHSHGARVVVHATELETARLAMESGTDILAHSVFDKDVDDAWLNLAQTRNVIYTPTLIVVGNYGYTFHGAPNLTTHDLRYANPDVVGTLFQMQDVQDALPPQTLAAIRARRAPEPPHAGMRNLKRIHEAGIRVAAGTDAGNIGTQHASSLYDEMITMVDSGVSPHDALAMATVGGAHLMGRLHELGSLKEGKLGDVVLLDTDPTHDIRAIASTHVVIKDGVAYEATEIRRDTAEQLVQRFVNALNAHDTAAQNDVAPGISFQRASHVEVLERETHGGKIADRVVLLSTDGTKTTTTLTYSISQGKIRAIAT